MLFTVSRFRLSILQVLLVVFATKLSSLFEDSLKFRDVSLAIAYLILVVLNYQKLSDTVALNNFSADTLLYLLILLVAFGIQYSYNTYCCMEDIRLYEQNSFKLIYRALKPLIMTYLGQLPGIYYFLMSGHAVGTMCLVLLTKEKLFAVKKLKMLYFTIPAVLIESIVLEELETTFAYHLLLPELFYFVEAFFNFCFSTIYILYNLTRPNCFTMRTPITRQTLLLEALYLALFVMFEIFIIKASGRANQLRFTELRENTLVAFDNSIENFMESFFTLILLAIPFYYNLLTTNRSLDILTLRNDIITMSVLLLICTMHGLLYTIQITYNSLIY